MKHLNFRIKSMETISNEYLMLLSAQPHETRASEGHLIISV